MYLYSPEFVSLTGTKMLLRDTEYDMLPQIRHQNTIRSAETWIVENRSIKSSAAVNIMAGLTEILVSPFCSNYCRTRILYLLGSISLKRARRSGALKNLWHEATECNSPRKKCDAAADSEEAREYFTESLLLLGSDCTILMRNIQRSLALVTGTGKSEKVEHLSSCHLINASIGRGTRRRISSFLRDQTFSTGEESA
jgi:hypothetical protein